MSPVDTIRFGHGWHARIYHDDSTAPHPYADDDAVLIVVRHRRYLDPSEGVCGRTPDEIATWERQNADEWFTIPLFLYDHSGTVYRVGRSNPFACRWDSGRVGIVALMRSQWGDGAEPDEKLTEYAESIAAAYTQWANGECYGYVLLDPAGRERDSCWGIIGIEQAREQAAAAAASRDPGDVPGTWGLRCPVCGDDDEIDIAATVWVRLCPNGTDTQLAGNGDHEWDDDHAACCNACGHQANVGAFRLDLKGGAS